MAECRSKETRTISAHVLNSEKDHNEVYGLVEPLKVDWVKLGMKLGVPYAEIEAIDKDKPTLEEKLMKMLSVWLKRGSGKDQPIPSWRILHDAVETLDRNIADTIARNHSARPADCVSADSLQHVGQSAHYEHTNSMMSTNVTKGRESISSVPEHLAAVTTSRHSEKSSVASTHLPDGLIDSVIELSCEYDSILTHIQTEIEEKVNMKSLKLSQIARFFSRCLRRTYCPLDPNDTLEDILQPITQSMNYIDPNMDLLVKVDREYCDCVHHKRLHQYSMELSKFRKSTLITNFITAIKTKRLRMMKSSKKKPNSDSTIIIRVDDMYSDAMVEDVLKLKEKIFRNLDVGLVEVHHSVLTIVYHIPHNLVTQAITIVEEQKSLLKELGVISVQIAHIVIQIRVANDVSLSDNHQQHDNDDIMSGLLIDLPSEGMLSIKPHWDNIGEGTLFTDLEQMQFAVSDDWYRSYLDWIPSTYDQPVDHKVDVVIQQQHTEADEITLSDDVRHPLSDVSSRANSEADSWAELPCSSTPWQISAISTDPQDSYVPFTASRNLLAHCAGSAANIENKISDVELNRLIAASRKGNEAIVDKLLKAGVDPSQSACKYGDTPLIAAVEAGHEAIVEMLLKAGASLSQSNKYGDTPLIASVKARHEVIVDLLLKAGVDPSQSNEYGDTPLLVASRAGHKVIVNMLLKAGADSSQTNELVGHTPLIAACGVGDEAIVDFLLKAGVDPSQSNKYGDTPLLAAVEAEQEAIVNILLKVGVNPSQSNELGDTPLLAASGAGNEAIVELLLKAGADSSLSNEYGDTPLLAASGAGHEVIVNLLLKAGVNPSQSNEYGDTPLIAAVEAGHEAIVNLLLKAGVDLSQSSEHGDTPLVAASKAGHETIVGILLKAGVDPSQSNKDGDTPLIAAVKAGQEAIVDLLLKLGADPSQCDKYGDTPLIVASKAGRQAIVDILLKAGADLSQSNELAYGDTPLIAASNAGHEAIVDKLLKMGVDHSQSNKLGDTPLIAACIAGHGTIVDKLLKLGVDPSQSNEFGNSPLSIAKSHGHTAIVNKLLKAINKTLLK